MGTAQGDTAAQIALAHPHLSGMGFDLAEVGPIFEEYVGELGLNGRLRFTAGNFFEGALPKTDVIVMGHILHDWDLPTKKMLIGKAYEALPKGGAFIVYEAIIDDDRSKNAFGLMASLNMLMETYGGFDYTGADCQGWMKEAGFSQTRVEHLVGPDSMVVGIKQQWTVNSGQGSARAVGERSPVPKRGLADMGAKSWAGAPRTRRCPWSSCGGPSSLRRGM